MENKPFVHMLKTPLAKYAFDVNTNQLIQVNEELYDYLKKIKRRFDKQCS